MSLIDNEWLIEPYENRTAFSVRYSEKLFDRQSDFQRVEIFQTDFMGRVLILNGCFMVTQKDAFIYHEMLVHPAMRIMPNPKKALVIGGGDGGAVTELVKYPSLESITLCEIDPMVVESCRKFFPEVSVGLDDPRVAVVFQDGAAFVRDSETRFDLIVVDSTDPVGPAKALYEAAFYHSVKRCLDGTGIAVFQTESPLFMEEVFRDSVKNLGDVFGRDCVQPYLATVPCYPGGLWSFTLCSERHDPLKPAVSGWGVSPTATLKYYDDQLHSAAFALPVFVREVLGRTR